jgi:peptidyl-prolyl cis-trans isomerase C
MRILPILAAAALLTSCADNKDDSAAEPAKPAMPPAEAPSNTFTMTQDDMESPTNIVVSVDGEVLTLGDLRMEANMRLSSISGAPLTPEIMAQMRSVVADQFISRTLILNEAKRRELSVSDADLQNELDEIKKMIPPEVSIDDMLDKSPLGREAMMQHIKNKILIEKVTDKLAEENIKLSKEEVDEFIEKNKADLTMPERVAARHILLLFDPKDDDAAKAEKKSKIEGIRKEIIDGADFAEMAKKHSQCGSAEAGGFLGEFDRSRMVPEFSDAAFSQKIGEVGPVIQTQFGYHIIRTEKHEQEGLIAREDIEARMRDVKMQTVMQDFLKGLREKADIKTFME